MDFSRLTIQFEPLLPASEDTQAEGHYIFDSDVDSSDIYSDMYTGSQDR